MVEIIRHINMLELLLAEPEVECVVRPQLPSLRMPSYCSEHWCIRNVEVEHGPTEMAALTSGIQHH